MCIRDRRRLGLLVGPIQPAVAVRSAFGMKEMPFEHWLVKVFLPRAYEAAERNAWPSESHVGVIAVRTFDGQDEYDALIDLLGAFDQAIAAYGQQAPG